MADHDRPLNPRGRRAAGAMRAVMHDLGLTPDVVLVSTARRTLETLEALEPWDETPLIEPMDALYLADRAGLFAALHGVAETARSVMLVGHNPGLHELALALAGPLDPANTHMRRLGEGYPTGALAEFTVPGPWSGLAPGAARLVRLVTPRDLPRPD